MLNIFNILKKTENLFGLYSFKFISLIYQINKHIKTNKMKNYLIALGFFAVITLITLLSWGLI